MGIAVLCGKGCQTQIEMISARLVRWGKQIKLVGLGTGSLTPWHYHPLCGHGLPMVCMDAQRALNALKARAEKTDKADARAEMLASGCYSTFVSFL
jgi:transposase